MSTSCPYCRAVWVYRDRYRRRIDRESGGVACHATRRVTDYYGERAPVVRDRSGRRGVARRSGAADGCSVLAPLVAEWTRARTCHRECGCLAGSDCLANGLRVDRRSQRYTCAGHRDCFQVGANRRRHRSTPNGQLRCGCLAFCDEEASRSVTYYSRSEPCRECRALPSSQRQWERRPLDSKAPARCDSVGDRNGCSAGICEGQTLISAGAYLDVPETEARGTFGEVSGQ